MLHPVFMYVLLLWDSTSGLEFVGDKTMLIVGGDSCDEVVLHWKQEFSSFCFCFERYNESSPKLYHGTV